MSLANSNPTQFDLVSKAVAQIQQDLNRVVDIVKRQDSVIGDYRKYVAYVMAKHITFPRQTIYTHCDRKASEYMGNSPEELAMLRSLARGLVE